MRWFIYHIVATIFVVYLIPGWSEIEINIYRADIFLITFASTYLSLWIVCYLVNKNYFFKVPVLIAFLGFLLKELIVMNLKIAYDIVSPKPKMHPVIIAVPLDLKSDVEIVALAVSLSFTPGTLSLKISPDRKFLYVHEMYPGKNIDEAKEKIKTGFEERIKKLI